LCGLLLLLTLLIYILVKAIRFKNMLLALFVVINALFFMVESSLNRHWGVVFFAFILSFLIFIRPLSRE